MKGKILHQNQKGFTLIELLSVMIIMGVMGSVAAKKVDFITNTAGAQVLDLAVKELNIRESLTWNNIKLSKDGWTNDSIVFATMDTDLGPQYNWGPKPNISGGRLHFKSSKIALLRIASTDISAGKWQKSGF
jgi:prepilin-type N-terminal cleavage/methylation domain-containing protein